MKMHRAYSVLSCREFNDEDNGFITIEGIASTPAPDRYKDIVDPMGAKFKTPMPFLWQHQHDKPVGQLVLAEPTKKGIPFTAKIPKVAEPGAVKDRVDEAIHSLRYGLVNAVSIGFVPNWDEIEALDDGGFHFKEWEWIETSLVTIPANSEALISTVKQFDVLRQSASGQAGAHLPASGRKMRTIPGPFHY